MQCLKKHAPQRNVLSGPTKRERERETKKNGGGSKTARPRKDDKRRRPILAAAAEAAAGLVYKLTCARSSCHARAHQDKDGDGRVEAEDDGKKYEAPPMYKYRQPQLYVPTVAQRSEAGRQAGREQRRIGIG